MTASPIHQDASSMSVDDESSDESVENRFNLISSSTSGDSDDSESDIGLANGASKSRCLTSCVKSARRVSRRSSSSDAEDKHRGRKKPTSKDLRFTSKKFSTPPWTIGDLVWARPGRPDRLPWWPAIIVKRPKNQRRPSGRKACLQVHRNAETEPSIFRVILLGPPRPRCLLSVSQNRLLEYAGRHAFEEYLRKNIFRASDKIKALRRFAIQPSLQSNWLLARELAESLFHCPRTNRLAHFPWFFDRTWRNFASAPVAKFSKPSDTEVLLRSRRTRSFRSSPKPKTGKHI
ncbi:unnamed protein product [Protopolystoma xenopodis]|uniref:PWWP domain-containing protein n=1 Tax=Protopolystoma xenopodis TaxID=117903 RepID=A0A3S5CPG9_9PLAT|nr:unnamed protein product [Protopolystoma xenopodis]